jgi:aminopeptidase N
MSTYAITFLTSDLVAGPVQEPETEVSVPLRVWSRPELTEKTEWARQLAPRALAHIERTLRTRFPLTKVDLVALPGFNAPVPAENWGIIFYR